MKDVLEEAGRINSTEGVGKIRIETNDKIKDPIVKTEKIGEGKHPTKNEAKVQVPVKKPDCDCTKCFSKYNSGREHIAYSPIYRPTEYGMRY
jgi:hypothetical protein